MSRYKSIVINVRVDTRAVATLHQHFVNIEVPFKALSTMMRATVENYANMVVNQAGAEPFEEPAEAIRYLEAFGLVQQEQNKRKISRILQEESLGSEGFSLSYMDKKTKSDIAEVIQKTAEKIAKGEVTSLNSPRPEVSGTVSKEQIDEIKERFDLEPKVPDSELNPKEPGQGAILGMHPGEIKE